MTRGRALAFPLVNLELRVTWGPSLNAANSLPGYTLNSQFFGESPEWATLLKLFDVLKKALGNSFAAIPSPVWMNIQSSIPIGSGLGSSAALGLAMTRSLLQASQDYGVSENPTPERLGAAGIEGERLFHQNPSGVDPFTLIHEKPIVFSRTPSPSAKTLSTQAFLEKKMSFILFPTGQTHNTREVQRAVAALKNRDPLIFEDLMDHLASNTENMKTAFEQGQGLTLGNLMNDSHFRLAQLGVSSPEIEVQVESLRRIPGNLGVKITGAGCGGYLLGLFENEKIPSDIKSKLLISKNPWSFLSNRSLIGWP